MKPHKSIWYLFLIAAIFVLGCDVSTLTAPQSLPTPAPEAIDTIVVQTAAAASTQTAAVIPPTLTPSFTPAPSKTPSVTPSPTITFIFIPPTAADTLIASQTPINGGDWSCILVSQLPLDKSNIRANANFSVSWIVKNTGTSAWTGAVKIIFVKGAYFSETPSFNLPRTVNHSDTISVSVPMKAPSDVGNTYTTSWSLAMDQNRFCPLTLTFTIIP